MDQQSRNQEEDVQSRKKSSLDSLYEISQILGTSVDKRTLRLCVELCEQGVPPENVAVSKQSQLESAMLYYISQEANNK